MRSLSVSVPGATCESQGLASEEHDQLNGFRICHQPNCRFNTDKNASHFCRLTWALGFRMTRQRQRHLNRMPLDEAVRLAMNELISGFGSVDVEVIDHDSIQGLNVNIHVHAETSETDLVELSQRVSKRIRELASAAPNDKCLDSWLATFSRAGKVLSTVSAFDREIT